MTTLRRCGFILGVYESEAETVPCDALLINSNSEDRKTGGSESPGKERGAYTITNGTWNMTII